MVVDAIGTEARYLKLRTLAPLLLLAHLGIRLIFTTPTEFSDLILFNSVGFVICAIAVAAPFFNDRLSSLAIATAIFLWTLASTISSWNSFSDYVIWPNSSEIAYTLFYPFLLFGMLRATSVRKKFTAIELLDVIIIVSGASSMLATMFLKSAMLHFSGSTSSVFLSILYPVGDLILVAMATVLFILQRKVMRSLLILFGITTFAATDFIFIWKSATTGYSFASLMDDGWLVGLLLLAESLWHHGSEEKSDERISSGAATASLIFTSIVLAIAAIKHNEIPLIALVPALLTIALSFVRMAYALRSARIAAADRELARTDELTGLANRRLFISALDELGSQEATLLLMDLDGFKKINDTLGHGVGDALLGQIATRFLRVITNGTLLARLGGDEFGVLIYGDRQFGLESAQSLQSCLTYPFMISGSAIKVGISIGRVINDGRGDLMKRADIAMYEAKRGALGEVLWQP